MVYTVLDLLPYDKQHKVLSVSAKLRILKLLDYLCQSSRKAVQSILYGEFDAFDAQVSENLCQLRAYQLSLILEDRATVGKAITSLSVEINKAQSKIKSLHDKLYRYTINRPSHYTKEIDKPVILEKFLDINSLNFSITEEAYFIIQVYLLSQYKIVDEHEICYGIDHQCMLDDIGIESKTFAKRFVHHLQKNVTKLSCNFIFRLLISLNAESPRVHLMQLLYTKDQDGRHVIACYEVTKLIIEHALKNNKKICVMLTRTSNMQKDKLAFSFKPNMNRDAFILDSFDNEPTDHIILFRGTARYKEYIVETPDQYVEKFLRIGFQNVILSNLAQHPQYPGLSLDTLKYNPYQTLDLENLPECYSDAIKSAEKEFLKHKYLAGEIGCLPENPSLFLLTHVRCANAQLVTERAMEEPTL